MSSLYDYDCLYGLNPPVYIDIGGGLWLYRVSLQRKESSYPTTKLAFHAKESLIGHGGTPSISYLHGPRVRAMSYSPDARGPPSPGLP